MILLIFIVSNQVTRNVIEIVNSTCAKTSFPMTSQKIPHSPRGFSEDISGYQTFDEAVAAVVADATDVVVVVVWAEVVAPRRSILMVLAISKEILES